jgi:hypothetical protein
VALAAPRALIHEPCALIAHECAAIGLDRRFNKLNLLGTGMGASTIDPLKGETPDAEALGISAV